jgi:hypothetical protein
VRLLFITVSIRQNGVAPIKPCAYAILPNGHVMSILQLINFEICTRNCVTLQMSDQLSIWNIFVAPVPKKEWLSH